MTSTDFGNSGEQLEPFKKLTKTNVTFKLLKNMLTVINNIMGIYNDKAKAEAAEKATFNKIDNLINALENPTAEQIPQADLVTVKNLLEITKCTLKLDNEQNKFCLAKSDGTLIPIYQVIAITNQFPVTLPVCPTNTTGMSKLMAENQMHRIKDGRAAATKMTLMHLVTGQGVKHFMVEETIKLCKTLYESTNLDLAV